MNIKINRKYKELLFNNESYDLDDDIIVILENNLANYTVDELFEKQLHYLNCTRFDKTGTLRLMQTIGVPYRIEMLKAVYIIETYMGGNESYYEQLLTLHKSNIEFEKINPPIVYKDKNKKLIKEKENKPKKEKAAKKTKEQKKEDKLKLKFNTFNILKIKL